MAILLLTLANEVEAVFKLGESTSLVDNKSQDKPILLFSEKVATKSSGHCITKLPFTGELIVKKTELSLI